MEARRHSPRAAAGLQIQRYLPSGEAQRYHRGKSNQTAEGLVIGGGEVEGLDIVVLRGVSEASLALHRTL